MSSIALVLVLIAIVSSFLITELHQKTAEEKLLNSIDLFQNNLEKNKARLIDGGRRLQANEAVLASTHLIWDYQNPDDYQPIIFDEEKKELINILELESQGTDYAFAGIYSLRGEWLSFYDARENIKAYGSYDKQGQALIKINGNVIKSADYKPLVMPFLDDKKSAQDAYYRLSHSGNDLILMVDFPINAPEMHAPELMARLYLGYIIDESFAEEISAKTGSNLIIYDQLNRENKDNVLVGKVRNQMFGEQIMSAMESKNSHNFGTHFMHAEDCFAVMFPLKLKNDKNLYVTFGLDKASLSSSIAAFQQAIFVVLLLSGLIVVPMGLIFARRTIINPVTRLTEFAKSLGSGESPNIDGFSSKDELGTLANAFNTMTVAIHMREEALRSKQREIEDIIENAPSVISMKTVDGKYLMVNHLFAEIFRLSCDDVIGRIDMDIFPSETAQEFRDNDLKVVKGKKAIQFEESVIHDEILHTYISNKFPLFDNDNNVIAVCSIATDITERKKAELKLSLAKNVIEHANEAVVITDLNGVIEEVNDAYINISGYSREEVIGVNPNILQSGHHDKQFYMTMWKSIVENGSWEGEMWDRRKNGEVYPKNLSISTVYDDAEKSCKYVGIFSDITERKETERQLKHLAYYDALTSLPNRVMFYDRLQQAVSTANRDDHLLAIMMIDLDRFKLVNDTLGHAAGDELLIIVAQKLKDLVRESDTVARIGGDEFKIILTDINSPDEASIVAQKVIDNLRQPIQLKGKMVTIGASIGIAIY
ncbi:MAG: diguanylate cyclase, partial [Gammaproteobacteria bacterium]|nr:diguanylate cyclase [Gammaproteobacteria bacterium]